MTRYPTQEIDRSTILNNTLWFRHRLVHHQRVSVVPPPPEFQSTQQGHQQQQQQQRLHGEQQQQHPPHINNSKDHSQGKGSPRPLQQGTPAQHLATSIIQTPSAAAAAAAGPSNTQQPQRNISSREEQLLRQQQHLQQQQRRIQQQLQQGGVVLVLSPEGVPSRVDQRQIFQGAQTTTTQVRVCFGASVLTQKGHQAFSGEVLPPEK